MNYFLKIYKSKICDIIILYKHCYINILIKMITKTLNNFDTNYKTLMCINLVEFVPIRQSFSVLVFLFTVFFF